jgi:hypothetical protein
VTRGAERSRALADAIAGGDAASLATLLDQLRRDDGRIARALAISAPGRPRADQHRDRLIAELRAFHPNLSDAEAARAIASSWRRYECAGWKHERLHPGNPYRAEGGATTPRAILFDLLAAGHSALSAEAIRRRLRAGKKLR